MAVHEAISTHTGETVTLIDLVPNLGITCYGVRTYDDRRCEKPAKFATTRGVLVCGHHTKNGQEYTTVEPGERAYLA